MDEFSDTCQANNIYEMFLRRKNFNSQTKPRYYVFFRHPRPFHLTFVKAKYKKRARARKSKNGNLRVSPATRQYGVSSNRDNERR